MKTNIVICSVVIAIFLPVSAQSADISLSTSQDATGSYIATVHNFSRTPVTAFAIVRRHVSKKSGKLVSGSWTIDYVLTSPRDLGQTSLVSGAESVLNIGKPQDGEPMQVYLAAVVYGDGKTAGDSAWVSTLLSRRKREYRDIGAALAALDSARTANISLPDLIAEFQRWLDENKGVVADVQDRISVSAIPEMVISILTSVRHAGGGTSITTGEAASIASQHLKDIYNQLETSLPSLR